MPDDVVSTQEFDDVVAYLRLAIASPEQLAAHTVPGFDLSKLSQRETINLGFYWWSFKLGGLHPSKWQGKSHWKCFSVPMPSEAVLAKRIGQALVFSTIVLLPIAAFVAQRQGMLFSAQGHSNETDQNQSSTIREYCDNYKKNNFATKKECLQDAEKYP